MRLISSILLLSGAAVLLGIMSPNAKANEWNKETIVTFDEPVEIPGHVLNPGTYDFKLEDSLSDRSFVEIWCKDTDRLVAIVMTTPVERVEAAGKSNFTFEQRNAKSPKAIKDWYYPGDTTGMEFVY